MDIFRYLQKSLISKQKLMGDYLVVASRSQQHQPDPSEKASAWMPAFRRKRSKRQVLKLPSTQEELRQLLQQQQNLVQQQLQQQQQQRNNVLSSLLNPAAVMKESSNGSSSVVPGITGSATVTTASPSVINVLNLSTNKSASNASSAAVTPAHGAIAFNKTETGGGLLGFLGNLLGVGPKNNGTGSNKTAPNLPTNGTVTSNSTLTPTTSKPIVLPGILGVPLNSTTTAHPNSTNPLLSGLHGNLSRSDKEEAELEAAPKGLILKVVQKGDAFSD